MSLVKRNENTLQEELVFLLERYGETVDDRAEDLEELGNAVELLDLVDEAQEDVVDLLANEGAQTEELAIDAVKNGLEEVAFARVLAVEELEDRGDEPLVDVLLAGVGLELGRLEKAQEELVDDLEMRPARLERRLVLLLVGLVNRLVGHSRQCAEYVVRDHGDDLRVHGLGEARLGHAYVIDDLVEACALDLLALQVGHRVHEVEHHTALLQLLYEQLLLVLRRRIFSYTLTY